MLPILSNKEIAPNIFEIVVEHPQLAKKAQAGHFVIVMTEPGGERIPLTIADFDADKGTVTIIAAVCGVSTTKLSKLKPPARLSAMIGPLGHPSEMQHYGAVLLVAGGVGTAPVYPIARALHGIGNAVITIQGSRSKDLLFWTDKMAAVSDEHILVTDDGSAGRKALVTEPLRELLRQRSDIRCVYMIGPAVMMKFCAKTVAESISANPLAAQITVLASLNSIMIDGTGMCGCCRVNVGGETKFTCVDGPEFPALDVDWDILLARQKMYCSEEQCAMQRMLALQAKT